MRADRHDARARTGRARASEWSRGIFGQAGPPAEAAAATGRRRRQLAELQQVRVGPRRRSGREEGRERETGFIIAGLFVIREDEEVFA